MTRKPKLLLLSQTLPYPPDGGVWIRTFNVYRLLCASFDVTMLCFERMGEPGLREPHALERSTSALSRFGKVEVFPVPQNRSRARLVWNHLRSLVAGRVYTNYIYESEPFLARLRELLATGSFDRSVIVWDLADPRHPQNVAVVRGFTDRIRGLAFSPDGSRLLTASGGTVALWDIDALAATVADPLGQACALAGGLNRAAWSAYLPAIPYRATCRQ